jgi:hypothetical protein
MDATDRKIQALEATTNRLLEVVETFAHGNKELEEEVKHFVEDAYKSLQPTVQETPAPVVSPVESAPEVTESVEEEMKPAKLEEPVAEEPPWRRFRRRQFQALRYPMMFKSIAVSLHMICWHGFQRRKSKHLPNLNQNLNQKQ